MSLFVSSNFPISQNKHKIQQQIYSNIFQTVLIILLDLKPILNLNPKHILSIETINESKFQLYFNLFSLTERFDLKTCLRTIFISKNKSGLTIIYL